MQSRTLYQMFQETVRQHGSQPAVGFRVSKTAETTYWSYQELDARVRAFRRGLDALGLRKGDRMALISHENQVEWALADLAAQSLGVITVPIYGTLPAAQVAYYVRDSGARAIVVSDAKQRAKVAQFRQYTPTLEYVIAMDGGTEPLDAEEVLSFAQVIQRGEQAGKDEAALDALSAAVQPDDVATLIYTSGTTGDPKGAIHTHTSMLHTPDAVVGEPIAQLGPGDVFLSLLPLSHITERVGGYYLPLRVGACIVYSRGLMAFAEEISTTVRPTLMLCVPRLFESVHQKIKDSLTKLPPKQRRLVEWGLQVGETVARRRSAGHNPGLLLTLQQKLAEKLVLAKIRTKATGGRMRYFISGGAPLDPDTAAFFLGLGIQVLEGYGLSETGILALNRPGRQRIGTVGTLLLDVELKLAEDGEILTRGPGRMQGYYNKPEANAEAIDAQGWFYTGDIGEMSADGYLKITDRKKDLIVLTNGKKVAPQPIEAALKHSPYIAEAVLFGDKQSTVMAILVPAFEALLAWAKSQELPAGDVAEFITRPEVQKLYKGEIEKLTSNLADFEKIKRFKLVARPFGIESGELTPTLKVKRKVIAEKYADLIATM